MPNQMDIAGSRFKDITIPFSQSPFDQSLVNNELNDTGNIEWKLNLSIKPDLGIFNLSFVTNAFLTYYPQDNIKSNESISISSEIEFNESDTELVFNNLTSLITDVLEPVIGEYMPITNEEDEITYRSIGESIVNTSPISIEEILGFNII